MPVILFSVKYKGESKLVGVSGTTTYSDFCAQLVGKWDELKNISFYCLCSVGSITSCCLDSEVDFNNILVLCDHTSTKLVLVELFCKFQCGDHNTNVEKTDQPMCGDHSTNVEIKDQPLCGDHSTNVENRDQPLCGDHNTNVENKDQPLCGDHFENVEFGKESSCDHNDSENMSRGKNADLESSDSFNKESGKRNSDDVGDFQKGDSGKKSKVHIYSQSDCEYAIPSYPVCPSLKKKPLLSDSWGKIIESGVGQQFIGGAVEFRKELIKFATHSGFNFKYRKNMRKYIHACCSEEARGGCTWFVKAKLISPSYNFEIFKANLNHSCVATLVCEDGIRMGSTIIADLIVNQVKNNHAISGKKIVDSFLESYGIETPYWKARRAIETTRKLIFGRYDESYNQLRWYKKAIERTNPGSVVFLEINHETNRFERMFIAFKASIDGFQYCRPMLFIDATFMKGRAKGTLLSATAKDGNNGLFPVAFAMVGAENTANWQWFLTKLRDEIKHDKRIVFISDRNTGIMSAFPLVWDDPLHYFCLFHLLTNLKGRFSRGCSRKHRANMAKLFTDAAYAPTRDLFHEKLELFKKEGGLVAEEWIEQLPFDKWAVSYCSGITRYGEMTSNAAESFNSWIRKARYLPVTNMIDSIRKKLSRWYVKRRKVSSEWSGALCPEKEETWQRYTEFGKSWKVDEYPNNTYEVHSTVSATVNLNLKVCTCYQWQIRGFPCPHAVRVIRKLRSSVNLHVDAGFLTKSYRDSYMGDINSIPDTERFENQCEDEPKIIPQELNTTPGRPRTKRKASYGEGKKRKKKICKTCGVLGYHDSISCLIARADESGTDSMQSSEDEMDTSDNND